MRTDTAATIFRHDYVEPSFWVDTVELGIDLEPGATRVAARSVLKRNPAAKQRDLVLNGEELELVVIRMNGKTLNKRHYHLADGQLTIVNPPDLVTLEIETVLGRSSHRQKDLQPLLQLLLHHRLRLRSKRLLRLLLRQLQSLLPTLRQNKDRYRCAALRAPFRTNRAALHISWLRLAFLVRLMVCAVNFA